MADDMTEPTLPRFPQIFRPSRKRARPGIFDGSAGSAAAANNLAMLNTSSDPAVFSSDDDPALDNYLPDPAAADGRSRKKKKRYVGTWFAQHPASADSGLGEGGSESGGGGDPGSQRMERELSPVRLRNPHNLPLISSPLRPQQQQPMKKQRAFERQYDSGVWMDKDGAGADGMDDMDDVADIDDVPAIGRDRDDEDDDDELARRAFNSSPPPPSSSQTSSASSSSSSSHLPRVPPALFPAHHSNFPPLPPRQRRVFQRVPSLAVNSAEQEARSVIQECIEAGEEEVSLIGLGLTTLSNATVEPLSGLVPIPIVTEGVAFEQKEPNLKVFLSNNNLTRLPGALFDLEHLTVLSLRGNGLTELSPAIGKLKNLKTLNVSLNALRYLPAELLPLIRASGQGGRLTELLVHPNRYVSYANAPGLGLEGPDADDNKPRVVRQRDTWPWRVARTPVCYKDSNGSILSAFAMKPMRSEVSGEAEVLPTEDLAVAPTPPRMTTMTTTTLTASRVPTLLELALEACYSAPQLPQLAGMLPHDAPPHLGRQLGKAVALRESGGCTCCVCGNRGKPLVAPMTEWVEWWEFAQADLNIAYSSAPAQVTPDPSAAMPPYIGGVEVLPFSFRGCSWGCVPAAVAAAAAT